jgi:dCMP deaminase
LGNQKDGTQELQWDQSVKQKLIDAYMDVAKRFAQCSTAQRLQVGAVIVKDDRIISIGYNGTPSGWNNVCEECCDGGGPVGAGCYHDHCDGPKTKPEVLHAEANALTKLARSTESGEGAILFITHSPCIDCAKLIVQSGIREVYYGEVYRRDEGLEFLSKCGIPVIKL